MGTYCQLVISSLLPCGFASVMWSVGHVSFPLVETTCVCCGPFLSHSILQTADAEVTDLLQRWLWPLPISHFQGLLCVTFWLRSFGSRKAISLCLKCVGFPDHFTSDFTWNNLFFLRRKEGYKVNKSFKTLFYCLLLL